MSTGLKEPDRLFILAQLHSIEREALVRSPEFQTAFFSGTLKGRFAIMLSILDPQSAEKYQVLMQSLDSLRLSVAA
jgi:hypothetical protein